MRLLDGFRTWHLCLALLVGATAQASTPLTDFPSTRLNRSVPLALHVPSAAVVQAWSASHPSEPMRLVVFLPGAWDGPEDLGRQGLSAFLAEREALGAQAPSLWVAVTHFQSWYADRADGSFPYERFLMDELIPALEAAHPGFGGSPEARSITGLSMGGFGALNLSARTGAFSRCLALSPALVRAPFDDVQWFIRRNLRKIFPSDPQAFVAWNPWRHLGGSVELVIGSGTEDKYNLGEACQAFARICADRGRPLQVDLRPGGHDWGYWTPVFKTWAGWLAGGPPAVPPQAASSLAAR